MKPGPLICIVSLFRFHLLRGVGTSAATSHNPIKNSRRWHCLHTERCCSSHPPSLPPPLLPLATGSYLDDDSGDVSSPPRSGGPFCDELGPEERDHLIQDIVVSCDRCQASFHRNGASHRGLMGLLTADNGSLFHIPQPPPNADPPAMASLKQAQVLILIFYGKRQVLCQCITKVEIP
jgi:hypothetical protein